MIVHPCIVKPPSCNILDQEVLYFLPDSKLKSIQAEIGNMNYTPSNIEDDGVFFIATIFKEVCFSSRSAQ